VVIEILFFSGIIEGDFWRIVEIGFEAATVGGPADWLPKLKILPEMYLILKCSLY